MSLLVPTAYDVLWSLFVLVQVVLVVAALLRWRHKRESAASAVGWLLVILLVPLLGPLGYLLTVPREPRRTTGRGAAG